MAETRGGRSSREAILEAATRVARRDGLLAMTLDNVAREAGVSKGGVMYHFASKDKLVATMIEHFAGQVREALTRRVADDPEPRGRWVRAFVDVVLPEPSAEPREPSLALRNMRAFYISVLAALAQNPELVAPLREFGTEIRRRVAAEGDMDQLLTWLAVDGLLLWNLFGMIGTDDPVIDSITAAIRARVRATATGPESPMGSGGADR